MWSGMEGKDGLRRHTGLGESLLIHVPGKRLCKQQQQQPTTALLTVEATSDMKNHSNCTGPSACPAAKHTGCHVASAPLLLPAAHWIYLT